MTRLGDRTRRHGFTLIELLVVIAIMAIIAAILFPVFAQARAKARQSTCASNLAQIARAGMMYVEDNDERFPSCYSLSTAPYAVDPRTSLQPYIKNWDLFYCPERQTVMPECLDPAHGFRPNSRCMGYGYNWGFGLGWGCSSSKGDGLVRPARDGDNAVVGVALSEVAAPAHCFFYGDTNDYLFITLRAPRPCVRKEAESGTAINDLGRPYEAPRHSDGNNFVFVDGHVNGKRVAVLERELLHLPPQAYAGTARLALYRGATDNSGTNALMPGR